MKKVLFTIAAAVMMFAATSCKKENVNEPENFNREPEAYEFLATAGGGMRQNAPAVNDGMGTMATFDPDSATLVMWQVGDVITVNEVEFTCTTNPGKGENFDNRAYFENESIKAERTGFHATEYHAFYSTTIESMALVEEDPTKGVTGVLSATQYYNPKNQAENLPMYAHSTDHWLNFSNICAAVKIYVPCTAHHIVIKNTSAAMNGAFEVQSNVAVMQGTDDDNKKITIYKGTQGHTTAFNACDSLYIAIPAGTYQGFEIAFLNQSEDTIYTTGAGGTLNVTANHIYRIVGYKYPNHLLPGKFKVGTNSYVQFTTGNLWRDGSEGSYTYHFEDDQTGYPTVGNETHRGHFTDLETTTVNGTQYDALSSNEFMYLLTHSTSSGSRVLYGWQSFAEVDGIWCLLVAPDGATAFNKDRDKYTRKEVNSMGLLCLPFAGARDNNGSVIVGHSDEPQGGINIQARYWASNVSGSQRYNFFINNALPYSTLANNDSFGVVAINTGAGKTGRSIRLVKRLTQE